MGAKRAARTGTGMETSVLSAPENEKGFRTAARRHSARLPRRAGTGAPLETRLDESPLWSIRWVPFCDIPLWGSPLRGASTARPSGWMHITPRTLNLLCLFVPLVLGSGWTRWGGSAQTYSFQEIAHLGQNIPGLGDLEMSFDFEPGSINDAGEVVFGA